MLSATSRRAAAAGLAAVLALAIACGGSGRSSATPSPSGTPAGTPVPTDAPSPSPMPSGPAAPITIATGVAAGAGIAVAAGGGGWLVAYTDAASAQLLARRLDADGAPRDAEPIALSADVEIPSLVRDVAHDAPALAFGGTAFDVVFLTSGALESGPGAQFVLARRVATGGALVGPAIVLSENVIGTSCLTTIVVPLAAASTPNETFTFDAGGGLGSPACPPPPAGIGGVTARRLAADGDGLHLALSLGLASLQVVGDGIVYPSSVAGAAASDDVVLAAWGEGESGAGTSGPFRVQGAELDRNAEPFRVLLASAPELVREVVVAARDDTFLVAWNVPEQQEIRGRLYRAGSGPDDGPGFLISAGGDQLLAGAAAAGDGFVVVWLAEGAVHAAQVSATGAVGARLLVDPGPVDQAAVASGGGRTLVVLQRAATAEGAGVVGVLLSEP